VVKPCSVHGNCSVDGGIQNSHHGWIAKRSVKALIRKLWNALVHLTCAWNLWFLVPLNDWIIMNPLWIFLAVQRPSSLYFRFLFTCGRIHEWISWIHHELAFAVVVQRPASRSVMLICEWSRPLSLWFLCEFSSSSTWCRSRRLWLPWRVFVLQPWGLPSFGSR